MLSTKMSDETDKSLAFRLVKYLLMVMYAFDILVFFLLLCLGCLVLHHNETAVQLFREDVKDFNTSYNQDETKPMAYMLIVSSILLIAVTIYFMYAAYQESLRQNAIIGVLTIFFTFLDLLFFSKSYENRFYSVWSVMVIVAYVYLLDQKSRSRMRRRSQGAQDLEAEANSDFNLI